MGKRKSLLREIFVGRNLFYSYPSDKFLILATTYSVATCTRQRTKTKIIFPFNFRGNWQNSRNNLPYEFFVSFFFLIFFYCFFFFFENKRSHRPRRTFTVLEWANIVFTHFILVRQHFS